MFPSDVECHGLDNFLPSLVFQASSPVLAYSTESLFFPNSSSFADLPGDMLGNYWYE
jgi:hypothetical protein